MSPGRLGLSWVPPLVVGGTLAAAAEISAALLLYSGPGLLRALTMILAVESGAAALGLWVAAGVERPRVVEAIRRRWLFSLVAFSAAAVTAGVWAVIGGFSDSRLGQGLGLAVLGGLPLYGAGAVAGLLSRPQAGLLPPEGSRWPRPEVLVVLGAGLGFLATGVLLFRGLAPTSVFLGCIVLLSGGALVHARLLRPDPTVRTVEERSTAVGAVRVEDRVSRRGEGGARLLRVNGRIRGGEHRDGQPAVPGEARVLEMVGSRAAPPARVLVLGAGVGTLVRRIALLGPDVRVDAVEESSDILSLARKHFPSLPEEVEERVRILEGHPRRPPELEPEGYDLVVADGKALDPGLPAPVLSPEEGRALRNLLAPGGTLVIHGLSGRDDAGTALDALVTGFRAWLPDVRLEPGVDGGRAGGLEELGVAESPGSLLVATRPGHEETEEMPETEEMSERLERERDGHA